MTVSEVSVDDCIVVALFLQTISKNKSYFYKMDKENIAIERNVTSTPSNVKVNSHICYFYF